MLTLRFFIAAIAFNGLLKADFNCFVPRDLSTQIPSVHAEATKQLSAMNSHEMDEDWKLNDFFGQIKVINKPSNHAGLTSIVQELESIGVFNFDVVPLIDGTTLTPELQKKCPGQRAEEAGRYMTHYKILRKIQRQFEQAVLNFYQAEVVKDAGSIAIAKEDMHRYRSVLILKDTIGFSTARYGLGRQLREALKDLPENWDIVYFYATAYQPVEAVTPFLQRINKSYFDVAYAVNYRMYGPLCHHLKRIEDPRVSEVRHIDHQISHIHRDYNAYAVTLPLIYLKAE